MAKGNTNLMMKVHHKAKMKLKSMYPDEYKEAMTIASYTGEPSWKNTQQRALTILRRNHRQEWRDLVNLYAQELGYSTAEMRRARVIAKAEEQLERLRNERPKVLLP